MNEAKLGQLIDEKSQRDAIHIAIAPVFSDELLYAGQHVGFAEPGNVEKVTAKAKTFVGIIDPFLEERIFPGKRCWLCLYPKSTTPMRHDWSHPAFMKSADKEKSEQWLRAFAASVGVTYGGLTCALSSYGVYQDRLEGERIEGVEGFDIPSECWDQFEIVTGSKINKRAVAFSCSC